MVGLAATVLASRPAEQVVVHPDQAVVHAGAVAPHPDEVEAGGDLRGGILAAALAGLLFGLFFVALDRAPDASGLWPLLGARLSGLTMLGLLLAHRRPAVPPRGAVGIALGSGLLDMCANALFLLATRQGLLVLVSVLTSLYPVGVVLLARVVLGERLGRWQQVGVALALLAVALIAS